MQTILEKREQPMDFNIGDKAVYRNHGVGVIKGIESRQIGGAKHDCYVLQLLSSGVTLSVARGASDRHGLRRLITNEEIEKVFKILRAPGKTTQTKWIRRCREFNEKLNSGSLTDVAEVLRDLHMLQSGKGLSFGEKNMMKQARRMIISEISAASARELQDVEDELNRALAN